MRVTVFGPNLNLAGQSKGDMHVHTAECGDSKHYGHGTKFGGDVDHKWTMDAGSREEVILELYPPEDFDYDPADWETYAMEVWFAPCVKF